MHGAGKLRLHRVGHIVLAHFACAPAGHVEEAVIERQVDIRHKGRHGFEALQQRRQLIFLGRLRRNGRRLLAMERAAFAPPCPDRAFEIRAVCDHPGETVFLDRVMGGTDLERHLMIGAEIDGLHVPAFAQVPEMQPVSILVGQQVRRHHAVLELGRQAPFARNHVVARQVPPEVVVLVLHAAVQFVTADHVERFAIHDEDAGRAVRAVGPPAPQRRNINAFRTAMDGVRP